MRILSVLEPSVLHADPSDWAVSAFIAGFQSRWLDLIKAVDDSRRAGCSHDIVVSLGLESLVWDGEHRPAWTQDPDVRRVLLPLYYRRLQPLMLSVDSSKARSVELDPELDNRSAGDPWLEEAHALLSWASEQSDDVVVQVGLRGCHQRETYITSGGEAVGSAPLCHDYVEFLETVPTAELCAAATAQHLPALIELGVAQFHAANPSREREYEILYNPKFLEAFEHAPVAVKPRILESIVSRVTQSQKLAQADKGLDDEPVRGRRGQRRLRVTRDWRIHYSYHGRGAIRFESVGPHDRGL